ncbi:MAG: NAD(P)-dependent alcohol dehydrogenase [Methanosphaera sp.]|uniref:NAD(P)-dependent alcohol dehydrogenase n=1 Tax=Methanosphaera sp. TaxID=2666342 RepID=UPI0025CBE695|nr:NAD(P)-dependent alcohol dehydrogenase [Methanosphaera sp.]MCI5867418.1 NAD(P)-dependent alcohol dehydrogenase [Methanosphaera sp.]MDD6534514.1 NAD(P)-dependent alcohol dehydrogenase [Methanosphaera sp.]MDY3955817.1 NAD(P)-dependent alcohol dehydrogenase [Methanosphaera sp.]
MTTFKGFAMKRLNETGWVEKEVPDCEPYDAIVRPTCVSPCTSDTHTVWEGAIGDRKDMVLGHEAVGIVEKVGSHVKNFKEGDKVIVPAITPDWDDEAAQRGFPSQTTEPLGGWKFSNFKDGVFGERFHVNLADANLALQPEELSDEAAVMLVDMWSTGMMGAENADIPLGGSVLVIGIGAVGLSAIAGAKLLGAGEIYAAGTRPISVKVAKKYGATNIINYKEGSIDQQVRDATDGAGVDSVIIAGGNLENTWKEAIASAKAGGTVSNVNYLSGADNVLIPRVEWGCGMSGIKITNGLCPGGRVRMERLASLALNKRADPELLVTHKFKGLEKIEEALYLMKDKPKDLIKPIVKIEE